MKAATALCFVVLVCVLYSLAQESAPAANSTGGRTNITTPTTPMELTSVVHSQPDICSRSRVTTVPGDWLA